MELLSFHFFLFLFFPSRLGQEQTHDLNTSCAELAFSIGSNRLNQFAHYFLSPDRHSLVPGALGGAWSLLSVLQEFPWFQPPARVPWCVASSLWLAAAPRRRLCRRPRLRSGDWAEHPDTELRRGFYGVWQRVGCASSFRLQKVPVSWVSGESNLLFELTSWVAWAWETVTAFWVGGRCFCCWWRSSWELRSEVTEHEGYSKASPKLTLHGCCQWQTYSWCGSWCWAGWWVRRSFGRHVYHGCQGDGGLTVWGCCPALGRVLEPVPRTSQAESICCDSSSQRCSRLWWTLLSLLSTEPQQLLCRQKSRNLGWVGGVGFLCCLPGLSFSNSSIPSQGNHRMGQPMVSLALAGLCTPVAGPGHPLKPPWNSHLQGLLCTELPGALVTIRDLLETKRHKKLEAAWLMVETFICTCVQVP